MNNLNSVLIEGYLLDDPLLRHTPKGKPVCTFKIVSKRYSMDSGSRREEVSWLQIEAWGQTAENCGKLGKKDRGVRVVGRLRQDRWTGADGKEKEKVTIVAEHVAFRPEVIEGSTVGKKKGNNG